MKRVCLLGVSLLACGVHKYELPGKHGTTESSGSAGQDGSTGSSSSGGDDGETCGSECEETSETGDSSVSGGSN